MKKTVCMLLLAFAPAIGFCATPAQEKAFVDAYRKAIDTKDEKTLTGFLYTKGADPQALEFYRMMMTNEMGSKISSIALEPLSADDKAKASATMPGPGGKSYRLTLAPVKKLVIKSTSSGSSGSSTSTNTVFVAEADGKLVIPVPGPAK